MRIASIILTVILAASGAGAGAAKKQP